MTGVQPRLDFEAAEAATPEEALVLDLDGFEGPLHALLALARTQKVDLLKLSVAALADQYLRFVQDARRRRFALAADYLVMAAWLAYLKSRLLLPRAERPAADEPPPEALAAALRRRLARLEAVRAAARALAERAHTGRDVFVRGDLEAGAATAPPTCDVDLYALMRAYAAPRRRRAARRYAPAPRAAAFPLEAARDRLRALAPGLDAWTSLGFIAPRPDGARADQPSRASYVASTFCAGLELVRDGALEARQLEAFADLYLRRPRLAEGPA